MKYIHEVNIARITHYSLRVAVWMEKHAVYEIVEVGVFSDTVPDGPSTTDE